MDYGLAYSKDLDRLVGGDFFRDLMGRPARSYLMSLRKAKMLYETLQGFSEAYELLPPCEDDSELPCARPLAVIEVESIPVRTEEGTLTLSVDELFSTPALSRAPLEYRQLAQLIAVLPGSALLPQNPETLQREEMLAFVRQLFRTLSCAHRHAAMAFSRSEGCCIQAESLSMRGELLDIYYATRASEARQNLTFLQQRDLNESIYLLQRLAGGNSESFAEALDLALRTYLPASLSNRARQAVISETTKVIGNGDPQEIAESVRTISGLMLTGFE